MPKKYTYMPSVGLYSQPVLYRAVPLCARMLVDPNTLLQEPPKDADGNVTNYTVDTAERYRSGLFHDFVALLSLPMADALLFTSSHVAGKFKPSQFLADERYVFPYIGENTLAELDSMGWDNPSTLMTPVESTHPWKALTQFLYADHQYRERVYKPTYAELQLDNRSKSPVAYRRHRVEQVARLTYFMQQRGLRPAGLLSYLTNWAMMYGTSLQRLNRELTRPHIRLYTKGNASYYAQVKEMTAAVNGHIKTLARALVQRVMSGNPKWDAHIYKLSQEYVELLKGLLHVYEDTVESLGGEYQSSVFAQGMMGSTQERGTYYLDTLSQEAHGFLADVLNCVADIEAGRFVPQWVQEHQTVIATLVQPDEQDAAA